MGWHRALPATALVAFAIAAPARAADQNVTARPDSTFLAPAVSVNPGDKVTWTNGGGVHNVHFEDGKYTAPVAPSGSWTSTVSRRFVAGGIYRYYCQVHGAPGGIGMAGTVNVQTPAAASYTWVGAQTGAQWTNSTNWSPVGVPGGNPADTASITTSLPELDVDTEVGGLTLTGGGGRVGAGELTVSGSGPLNWTNAWLPAPGTTVIGPNRTVNWSGILTGTLRNLGTLNWTGGAIGDGGAPDPNAILDNDGILNVSASTLGENSGGAGRIENGGTLRSTGSQVRLGPKLANTGVVHVVGGQLWLEGGQVGSFSGDFLVDENRTLVLFAKAFTLDAGAQVGGAGNVRITGGAAASLLVPDLPGTGYDIAGVTEVEPGAVFALDQDGSTGGLIIADLTSGGGRAWRGGDGTLTVGARSSSLGPNSTFRDTGLTIFGPTSNVTAQGMVIDDAAKVRFDGQWTAPSRLQLGNGVGGPEAPELHVGGTLSLPDGTFTAGIYDDTFDGSAVLRVLDGGHIIKETAGAFELAPRVLNAGTISATKGIIRFTGPSAGPSPGELRPGADATFLFTRHAQVTRGGYELGPGGSAGGAGELLIYDATVSALPGSSYNALTTRLETGGVLRVHAVDAATGGLVAAGGTRDGPGSLSVGVIAGDGTATFADGQTTVASGTTESALKLAGGATLRFLGSLRNNGSITWGDGVGTDGGRLEVAGQVTALGTLTNDGSTGSALRLLDPASFHITGSQAIPVTLETLGTLTVGGTLDAHVKVLGGVTGGAGTIGGDLTVEAGTLRPGAAEPGTLTVTGNYVQTGGTFEEEIDDTSAFDVLAVGGSATLGGTLAIVRDADFSPAVGIEFPFITAASQPAGAFAALTGAAVGPNAFTLRKDASPAGAALVLEVGAPANTAPPSIPGSANVGDDLSCQPGSWSGAPSFSYAWFQEGGPSPVSDGQGYVVQPSDVGRKLFCRVTATNGAGSAAADSNSSSVLVPATQTATVTATATATATATPTATVTASATPDSTHRTVPVSTLATLPAAKKCVRNSSLRLRLRTPPGETIVEARIKVPGKRDVVVRGAGLRRVISLRRLPRGRFAVTIVIESADGDTLTGRRGYRACRR